MYCWNLRAANRFFGNIDFITTDVFKYTHAESIHCLLTAVSLFPADEDTLRELTGPGSWEQWRHWTYRTQEHKNRIATKHELERLLKPQNVILFNRHKYM